MKYVPDFKNGRVQKRLNKVLDWAAPFCVGSRGAEAPVQLSSRVLNQVFGPKGNELGDYLREQILKVADASYSNREGKGFCKTYWVSREGFNTLEVMLQVNTPAAATTTTATATATATTTAYVDTSHAVERLVQMHWSELQELVFEYKDASSRLWHPLQNLRRAQKQAFWTRFGLPFDYDIQACAPTILFEMARQSGMPLVVLETLRGYLDDRAGFRSHVMALAGLDKDGAKRLVNSLFNGAKLGKNPLFSSFQALDYDDARMDALKSDPQVTRLVAEIKRVWKRIEAIRELAMRPSVIVYLQAGEAGEKVEETWKVKTSKAKWSVYFTEERRILDAIRDFLSERDVRVFTEHDGFRTDVEIDLAALEKHVLAVTGYALKIEQKHRPPSRQSEPASNSIC